MTIELDRASLVSPSRLRPAPSSPAVSPPAWADPDVEHCLGSVAATGPLPDSPDRDAYEAWLFVERRRYLETGCCDAWAEHLLRRAGLLPRA